jgi:HSP20 family protein
MTTQELVRNEAAERVEYSPAVDIFEDKDALWVSADLPGVAPGNVEVSLDAGYLTVTGRLPKTNGSDVERAYSRRFALSDPSRFDTEHISAVLRQGVLELKLPKAAAAQRRQIPVTVH